MSAMKRFGAWKWGKLIYSTGVGGLQCASTLGEPLDAGLTARMPGSTHRVGRHNTIPVELGDDHIACQYQLGEPYSGVNVSVRTRLWLINDWAISLHRGRAHQPTELCHGGFAIADPVHTHAHHTTGEAANHGFGTRIVNVAGFTEAVIDQPSERQHLTASRHAVPYLRTDTIDGEFRIACAWSLGGPALASTLVVERVEQHAAIVVIDGERRTLESPDWASS